MLAVLAAGAEPFFLFFFLFFFFLCLFVCFFISSILSSFSNASSLGRRLDILKYCGLGRYNPTVLSVTTGSVLAKYWLTLSRSKPAQEKTVLIGN